ncbi:MAG: type VI secretion system Vgr family protein [Phycisphaerales bacterium JB037]
MIRALSATTGWTQENRSIGIETTLGPDALLLRSIRGREAISTPFEMLAEVESARFDLRARDLLGTPVRVRLSPPNARERSLTAFVARFERLAVGRHRRLASYRLTLVPWLWFLSLSTDCRIYQDESAIEILRDVFARHGFSGHVSDADSEDLVYERRRYCVQYRERSIDFVHRLLEEEGLFYSFQHSADNHTIHLSASPFLAPEAELLGVVRHRSDTGGAETEESVWDLRESEEVRAARFASCDFNFKRPWADMEVLRDDPEPNSPIECEVYEYPGGYGRIARGDHGVAPVRLEELLSERSIIEGETNAPGIAVGTRVRIHDDPLSPEGVGDYFITGMSFEAHSEDLAEGRAGDPDENRPAYRAIFRAIRSSEPLRPPRKTPKPRVEGPQTAIVVGRPGEHVHVDEHARVKVKFHWDRRGEANDRSSCWIRCSQPWAGAGYGGLTIPRVGQEVIVDFLEGDPDRPIITGRVYNGSNGPPVSNAGRDPAAFPNPADIRQAAMMTSIRSETMGGGGNNEITMNDTPGGEGLFIKAQRDEIHVVGNDRSDSVANNETRRVGVDRSVTIGNDDTLEVANNASETVGVDKTVSAGSNIVIEAGTSITLRCGASSIHMNQAGVITISGMIVTTQASAAATMTAPLTTVAGTLNLNVAGLNVITGGVTSVSGGALTDIKGGTIQLNC